MFYIFNDDWSIRNSSTTYIKEKWYKTIEENFSMEDQEKINKWYLYIDWKLVQSQESLKRELINEYKEIKKEAVEKRSKYLTAELLPEWEFKTMNLEKLEKDRIEIEDKFNRKIQELIELYWKEILNELI